MGNLDIFKKTKYKNNKVIYQNEKFDSKLELNIYLKLRELISKFPETNYSHLLINRQPKYKLLDKFKLNGKTFRETTYIADFEIKNNGIIYTIDAKGLETPVFKLKKKLFAQIYQREIVCIKSVKQLVEWFEKEIGGN